MIYRESSVRPLGAYLISDTPEGGLLEFVKSDDKDIYDSFTPYFKDSAYNYTSQIHKFDTLSIPNTINTCKLVWRNIRKIVGNFWNPKSGK